MSPPSSSEPSPVARTHRRLRGIDSARGAAMVLVCLSHFVQVYFRPSEHEAEREVVRLLARVASPTFMLISGMMIGLLQRTRPRGMREVSRTLAGRGVFLLTLGHAWIVLTFVPLDGGLGQAATRGFITDAIGVAILLGPFVVQRVDALGRLLLALSLYVAGTVAAFAWHPDSGLGDLVHYVLGGPGTGDPRYNFPLLAWLSVYFAGSSIGDWMGREYLGGGPERVESGLLKLGATVALTAIAVKLGFQGLRAAGLVADGVGVAYALTSPYAKLPPSPVFLLLYGGLGLLMTGLLLRANRRGVARPVIAWLSELGRASLFVFLLQFFVYYVAIYTMHLPYTRAWPLLFVATLVPIGVASRWWLARGWNRHFDVTRWFGRTPEVETAPTAASPS